MTTSQNLHEQDALKERDAHLVQKNQEIMDDDKRRVNNMGYLKGRAGRESGGDERQRR
jgi:hypothetical protein